MNRRELLSGALLAAFWGASSGASAAVPAGGQRQALCAARAAVLQAADLLTHQGLTAAEAEVVAKVRAVLARVPELQAADPVYVRLLASLLERVCANAAQDSAGSTALAPLAAACQQVVDAAVGLLVP